MKWKKITVQTITEAEDIIISTLYDIGLEGAQVENKVSLTEAEKEQMFVDIPLVQGVDDGISYLNFFVEIAGENDRSEQLCPGVSSGNDNSYSLAGTGAACKDLDMLVEEIAEELEQLRLFMDIGEGSITVSETEDKDWMNNWKEYFHQFYIDDLLVTPSWEDVPEKDADKKVLHIDPGSAFGTGMHETTQLCVRQLKKYVKEGDMLLDIGTGSGILGIVSLLYGVKGVVGTDLDSCAIEAVKENLIMNRMDAKTFHLLIGNLITDEQVQEEVGVEAYDVAVANILTEVLVPLAPVVARTLKQGAIFITSGIIEGKEILVQEAMEKAGMQVLEVRKQGEWVSVTSRK